MTKRARQARIYSGTARNLALLAGVLRRGGLVAVPTETVYGLAANALDAKACAEIFRAKGRPQTDPLIVHVEAVADLEKLAVVNEAALVLAKKFWPGPLTIVLPKKAIVPDIVSAGLPSVAVRMPAHPLFRKLLRLAGVPLAAPSANPFGYVSPTTAEHVRTNLGTKIGYILEGGPCAVGVESTIIDLRDAKRPRLLRPGAVTQAQLEAALGVPVRVGVKGKVKVKVALKAGPGAKARRPEEQADAMKAEEAVAQVAPGMLTRHYSPRTPVVLHDQFTREDAAGAMADRSEAWVFLAKPKAVRGKNIFWLDARGDLRGVARRLFAMLRELDDAGFARIHVERASGAEGLAEAINDRLRRAAAQG